MNGSVKKSQTTSGGMVRAQMPHGRTERFEETRSSERGEQRRGRARVFGEMGNTSAEL